MLCLVFFAIAHANTVCLLVMDPSLFSLTWSLWGIRTRSSQGSTRDISIVQVNVEVSGKAQHQCTEWKCMCPYFCQVGTIEVSKHHQIPMHSAHELD